MYLVVYKRDDWHGKGRLPRDHYTVIECAGTLLGAKMARKVSGDLVYTDDGALVTNDEWLWDSERENPKSYARRNLEHPVSLDV